MDLNGVKQTYNVSEMLWQYVDVDQTLDTTADTINSG